MLINFVRPPPLSLSRSLLLLLLTGGCADDGGGGSSATESTSNPGSTVTMGATSASTSDGTTTTSGGGSDSMTTSAGEVTTDVATASTSDPSTSTSEPTTSTSDPTTETDSTTETTGVELCAEGSVICEGNLKKTCDGMGGFSEELECDDVCVPELGCVLCVPGSGSCEGDELAKICDEMGAGYVDEVCNPVQGVVCDPDQGTCAGACAPSNLGTSYIGCEYRPTVTPNVVGNNFPFAVVVSNTGAESAHITITRGPNPVQEADVPPASVLVIELPWVDELKGGGASRLVVDGAYRLQSTQPITLYQYNPLDYQKANSFSYTNDASLLIPVNAWTGDYWVATRNTLNGLPGAYAVVASADGTTVKVTPSATGQIVQAGGGIAANGTGEVTLGMGDVLLVLSGAGGGNPDISDLTGTHVESDKPVQVISAHQCTYVPWNITACDHLEASNFPYEALAKEYIVTTPWVKALNQDPTLKARMVRVIATEDATTITYDPPQDGAPTALAQAGDYFELAATAGDFKIAANTKIVVSEYMQGQQAGGNAGDPAMTIAVPIEQYRLDYLFHAPTNYESSFVNITAPMAAKIDVDGAPIPELTAIGGTGFGVARVQLSNAGDGSHTIVGDLPFGVQVYGYGQYTSYWYPGGLDLKLIPQ